MEDFERHKERTCLWSLVLNPIRSQLFCLEVLGEVIKGGVLRSAVAL